ncbi:MAG: SixA phosphatase family protein [Alkalispirochaeta sp.]
MKYLTLIRHAKSSHADGTIPDIDRPLNDRGRADAAVMGRVLASILPVPQIILGSTAVRVVETLTILLEAAGKTLELPPEKPDRPGRYPAPERSERLYLAEVDDIWDLAYPALLEHDEVWLCGHNPGIAEAIEALTGSHLDDVPTLAVARIAYDDEIPGPGAGELRFFDVPRNHRDRT